MDKKISRMNQSNNNYRPTIAQIIAKFYFRLAGWQYINLMPIDIKQCVMLAAPHTSNWDAFYTRIGCFILDIPVRITIKDSYLKPPIGWLVRRLGGVGINRTQKVAGQQRPSMVDAMAALFERYPEFAMLVSAEGTRSRVTQWKTGFYYVALKAEVPIALGYVDYRRKCVGVDTIIYPSGDIESDMRKIMMFYQTITPKHPHLFSLDERYLPLPTAENQSDAA